MKAFMKTLLIILSLFLLVSCKKAVYIETNSSAAAAIKVKDAKFETKSIQKIELLDFKKAFAKKYNNEETFIKDFDSSLKLKLDTIHSENPASFTIEFPKIVIGNNITLNPIVSIGIVPFGSGSAGMSSTEYCKINLSYIVKTLNGEIILEGVAMAQSAEGSFLHPNISRLTNAIEAAQKNLTNYLRGKMDIANIQPPPPPKQIKK